MELKSWIEQCAEQLRTIKTKSLDYQMIIKAFFVPRAGIEPALPKELDFESSASTNSATEAI